MDGCTQRRSFMDEMHDIICEIETLKPEPEVCNVSCPPLGCPLGPCPGMCCTKGICDPCCVSKMPRDLSCRRPPRCCIPQCLKAYTCNAAQSYGSSLMNINPTSATRNGGCNPIPQSGFQQALCPPPYNLISTVLPRYYC